MVYSNNNPHLWVVIDDLQTTPNETILQVTQKAENALAQDLIKLEVDKISVIV